MRALYAAASGMSAQQTQLETIANNIANVGTTGFKKSKAGFEDLFYQEMTSGGKGVSSARVEVGSGVRLSSLDKDHSTGTLSQTNNPLDMALSGRGYFELRTPEGEPVYTRDGSFTLDADGMLVTASGLVVEGDIVVPPDAETLMVTPDGTVQAILSGDTDYTTLGQLSVVEFVNPSGLRALGGNVYGETPESGDARPLEFDASNRVMQGVLEGSNVDIAEELVAMIMTQRAYELNSKVVQAADETLQVATQLRR